MCEETSGKGSSVQCDVLVRVSQTIGADRGRFVCAKGNPTKHSEFRVDISVRGGVTPEHREGNTRLHVD